MDYAVVLYMNEEKTAMVKEWIKELAPVCGSDYCLCTEPHITISAIIADDEELVKKEAAELSKVLKKGEIEERYLITVLPTGWTAHFFPVWIFPSSPLVCSHST